MTMEQAGTTTEATDEGGQNAPLSMVAPRRKGNHELTHGTRRAATQNAAADALADAGGEG